MFTSATGYIFSFGLSRRRHEPPFKPGGSVGALVGRPGFRAGFARIRARGRGRGSVGAACSSRKKSLWIAGLQSSYHLIYSLAWPPRCAAAPCSPAYCVFPTTEKEKALAWNPSKSTFRASPAPRGHRPPSGGKFELLQPRARRKHVISAPRRELRTPVLLTTKQLLWLPRSARRADGAERRSRAARGEAGD